MDGSGLTPFAWIFMLSSMGAVTALAVYCYYRILTTPGGPKSAGQVGVTGERPVKK